MTFRELLKDAEHKIADNGMEVHAAKILMMSVFKMESYEILSRQDDEVSLDLQSEYESGVEAYLNNTPIQYITGTETFYGYEFNVNENVLIPRFETEELVYNTLEKIEEIFENNSLKLVDVGCGSGAIGLTLKKENPELDVSLTDISEKALEVATSNAEKLDVEVNFYQGDMLAPVIDQKFDILISNPPYIPADEDVDSLVKDNEPHVALFGGNDGLKFYKVILDNAKYILKDKYLMGFEIGFDQAERIMNYAHDIYPDANIECVKDMQGKDRMIFITNK